MDWENLIKLVNGNVDQSFISFVTKFNSFLYMYAPLIKISKQKLKFRNTTWVISKQKLKFRNTTWVTLGLQKSISIKNDLITKYIKLKDVKLKLNTNNTEIYCLF